MIKITNHELDSKMHGFQSINIWSECSAKLRGDPDSVCHKCYYYRRHRHFPNLTKMMKHNLAIFNKRFEPDQIPFINARYFRFSAFGDISKVVHAENFIFIAHRNPDTQFGWWTKKPTLVERAAKRTGYWPSNIRLNVSSDYLDKPEDPKGLASRTFTVYRKGCLPKKRDLIKEHEVLCQKQCMDCLVCYTKNGILYVHEEVK